LVYHTRSEVRMLKSKLKLKTDELRNLKQPESLKATRLVRLYGGRKLC